MKGTIHLLCGQVGSGKSTFAKAQALQTQAIVLSIDDMMLTMFGEGLPREEFDRNEKACKAWQAKLASQLGLKGLDVYLDWGFWRKQERMDLRKGLNDKGLPVVMHLFAVDFEKRLSQVAIRNQSGKDDIFQIAEHDLRFFDSLFESPGPDEQPFLLEKAYS